MAIKYFKIYGERNSGTNYLYQLFRRNFNLKYLGHHWDSPFQWKHDILDYTEFKDSKDLADQTLFLHIYKNPYSWSISMHHKPHHMNHMCKKEITMSEFLNSNWDEKNMFSSGSEDIDTITVNLQSYENVFDLRYKKMDSHLGLINHVDNFYSISYEDLLQNPDKILKSIRGQFELVKNSNFLNVNFRCDPVRRNDLPFSEIHSYYLN